MVHMMACRGQQSSQEDVAKEFELNTPTRSPNTPGALCAFSRLLTKQVGYTMMKENAEQGPAEAWISPSACP